jgi:hypothetical protein
VGARVGIPHGAEHSDPPADLAGDDLRAYQDVLAERARVFSSRGEELWADMLRKHPGDAPSDPWLEQARAALWERLAGRFLFRPEVEFPLVRDDGGGSTPTRNDDAVGHGGTTQDEPRAARTLAQRDKDPR